MIEGMADLLARAQDRAERMRERLRLLVDTESPSNDPDALAACVDVLGEMIQDATGRAPELIAEDGVPHLYWRGTGKPKVLLLGHYDTVWPKGTVVERPFVVDETGRAMGPGVLDMKAGLVQMLTAMEVLDDPSGVLLLCTGDEEVGSRSSRPLIEQAAQHAGAVLVGEASGTGGAVKIARRGTARYRVNVVGRAAHAGEEPEYGINAAVEMAHQILALSEVADAEADTTVTPTVTASGTTLNTVPESARIDVDVRAWTADEIARVDAEIHALAPRLPGAALNVVGGHNRHPLEPELARPLADIVAAAAADLGIPAPGTVRWRSASDANITAELGVPTLCGCGAVGEHPHAREEYVDITTLPERAALLAATIARLR